MSRITWTPEKIIALGVSTDVPTAADILTISRSHAYALARQDAFPVPVLRLGTRVVVPVAGLLRLLGIDVQQRLDVAAEPSVHGHRPADSRHHIREETQP